MRVLESMQKPLPDRHRIMLMYSQQQLSPPLTTLLSGVDFIRLSALEELDLGAVIDENGELLYAA